MELTGIREMNSATVTTPRIETPTDVLVRITSIGVCGSDIHYYTRGNIGSQVVQYPFVVGHECAGIVAETGETVSTVKKGDKIAVDPAMPCGKCDQCAAGRAHTCRNLRFLGCPGQAQGCMSEYICIPETSCYPVPPDMEDDCAVLAEPLSIGIYASTFAPSLQGRSVAILGSGPIGLSVLLACRDNGAGSIYTSDKLPPRMGKASELGATASMNADTDDVVQFILQKEQGGVDVVFECCGDQDALDQAVSLLKPGGQLVIVGIPEPKRVSFEIDFLRRRELQICNVRRQNKCMRKAIDAIHSSRMNAGAMKTHRFPFKKSKDAFDCVAGYLDDVIKAIIYFPV